MQQTPKIKNTSTDNKNTSTEQSKIFYKNTSGKTEQGNRILTKNGQSAEGPCNRIFP